MTELLSKTESNNNKNINSNKFNVLFLGTGVSTAIPNIQHVLNNSLCNPCTNSNENSDSVTNSDSNDADDSNSNDKSSSVCKVCIDAMNNPLSKNRRNNVSIAITFDVPNNTDTNTANSMANSVPNNAVTNTTKKCILIDVGKTMRDACITKLPAVGVSKVDGIVLTHGHADAVFGLDDVRDLQQAEKFEVIDSNGTDSTASIGTTGANSITKSIGFKIKSGPLPIYLNQETMAVVQNCFGYLTGKPDFLDEKNLVLKRRVALLDFQLIESNSSFFISGLPIKAFPVYHGGTYVSLGFNIGKEGEFIYISDVKIIPEESWNYLKSIPSIKVLVIDALDMNGIYSHMGLKEALEVIDDLKPERAYLTGMSCGFGLHDSMEKKIAKKRSNVFLAYDGLFLSGFDQ